MSLRTRLLVGLAVLVFAGVSTAGWSVLAVARRTLQAADAERARVVGAEVVALLERAPSQVDTAASLVQGGGAEEIVIVDDKRHVLAAVGAVHRGEVASDAAVGAALAGVANVVPDGAALDYVAPLRQNGRVAGVARVRLAGAAEIGGAVRNARMLLLGVTLVDGGLVLLFATLFIRRVVMPLEALSAATRRVADGEIDVPPLPSPATRDEVAHLVDDFNRMTASLRRSRDQMVAQEKLATVGRLAAGVAHEVGNPLAAVLGYVDLLLHDEPAGSERRDALERIRKETDRMRGIVRDLLDYSRPVQGEIEPVRLADALDVALSLLKPQPRFSAVEVARELPADLPSVAASQSRLVQVLVNLLLNAADATGGAGRVTLRARSDGDAVTLEVADSGPGVAEADRGRIFDPFFTTKEPGHGTGLGLSISRSAVEAWGGTLALAPSEQGATFVVRLPIAR